MLILLTGVVVLNAVTPGLAMKRRQNYPEAIRLLYKERTSFPANSLEYQNYTFEIVECMIGSSDFDSAIKELDAVKTELLSENFLWNYEILKNIVIANTQKGDARQKAINFLTEIFKNPQLSQANRLITVKFTVPLLVKSKDNQSALQLLKDFEWNLLDKKLIRDRYNLNVEYCKLLIYSGEFDKAAEELKMLSAIENNPLKDTVEDLNFLLISYKNMTEEYFKNRPSISRQNSIIHNSDLKMAEYLTNDKTKIDELHKVLQFAIASAGNAQSAEYFNALNRLIKFEMDNKLYQSAIENIDKFCELYPNDGNYAVYLGNKAELYLAIGDNDKALATYLGIVKNETIAMDYRLLAAELAAEMYRKNDDSQKFLPLYEFILKNSSSKEDFARVNMILGNYYFGKEDYKNALIYLLEIDPPAIHYKNALLTLIQCSHILKDYNLLAKSVADMEQYIASNKTVSSKEQNIVKFFKAALLEATDQKDKAIAIYKELIDLKIDDSPYTDSAILRLGEIYFAALEYTLAAEQFVNYAKKFPQAKDADKALYRATHCYYTAKKFDNVLVVAELLKKNFPTSPYTVKVFFHTADYYYMDKKFDNALETLAELEKLLGDKNLNNMANVIFKRATIYYCKLGTCSKVQEELQKLLAENSIYADADIIADAYFLNGIIFTETGENDAAIRAFESAKAKRPDDRFFVNICDGKIADNQLNLNSKYRNIESLNQAIEIYQNLTKSSDPFIVSQSYYKLGRCYEELDEPLAAFNAYKDAISLAIALYDNGQNFSIIWVNKSGANAIKLHSKQHGEIYCKECESIMNNLKELNGKLPAELQDLDNIITTRR